MATDLLTAITTLVTKLIPNSTGDRRTAYIARLSDYSRRLLDQVVPPLVIEHDEDEATVDEPLSQDAGTALAQILAATGHPLTFTDDGATIAIDPAGVAQDASEEQNRELGLLGMWGVGPNRFAGGDHSLRDQYYTGDGTKPIDPDIDPWKAYLRGRD